MLASTPEPSNFAGIYLPVKISKVVHKVKLLLHNGRFEIKARIQVNTKAAVDSGYVFVNKQWTSIFLR